MDTSLIRMGCSCFVASLTCGGMILMGCVNFATTFPTKAILLTGFGVMLATGSSCYLASLTCDGMIFVGYVNFATTFPTKAILLTGFAAMLATGCHHLKGTVKGHPDALGTDALHQHNAKKKMFNILRWIGGVLPALGATYSICSLLGIAGAVTGALTMMGTSPITYISLVLSGVALLFMWRRVRNGTLGAVPGFGTDAQQQLINKQRKSRFLCLSGGVVLAIGALGLICSAGMYPLVRQISSADSAQQMPLIPQWTMEDRQQPLYIALHFLGAHAPPTQLEASVPDGSCKQWLQAWMTDFESLIDLTHSDRPGVKDSYTLGVQLHKINDALMNHLTQNFDIMDACGRDKVEMSRNRAGRWANGGKLGVLVPKTYGVVCFDPPSWWEKIMAGMTAGMTSGMWLASAYLASRMWSWMKSWGRAVEHQE